MWLVLSRFWVCTTGSHIGASAIATVLKRRRTWFYRAIFLMFVALGTVVSENKSPASSSLCVCDAAGPCPSQIPSLSPGIRNKSIPDHSLSSPSHVELLLVALPAHPSLLPIPGDGLMCPPCWQNSCGILTKPRLCQTFPSQPAPSLWIPAGKGNSSSPAGMVRSFSGRTNPCLQQWDLWLQLRVESSEFSLSPGQALGSGDGAH